MINIFMKQYQLDLFQMNFEVVTEFEKKIAEFFGAPYAVATDSCTSAVELSLRYTKAECISCPEHTYLSIPMLADKLNIELWWRIHNWKDYYYLTDNVIDAAVLWKKIAIFQIHLCVLVFNIKST